MNSIDVDLANKIRKDILQGNLANNARITEAFLCEEHNVSRTPVRLALRLLEREGIIRKSSGRGYVVNEVTVEDIRQAVEVRGHLESLAARLMAERENDQEGLDLLAGAIEIIDQQLAFGQISDEIIRKIHAANVQFHSTILSYCGNAYVQFTCEKISHLPMLQPGSMMFDRRAVEEGRDVERNLLRLQMGNTQHQVIYESIERGESTRAEGMMREHSHTMLDYISMFEKRNLHLSLNELVSYSVSG